ncbi:hypothetical protein DFJ73DRAFT_312687 [Zopfochytrium polystomum]|nr:hypothetical protein DFJ73DRAFT_312687 [Zopfochytrium polystomum]
MQVLSTSSSTHFIILFRGVKNHAFKGLFSYEPGAHTVERIFPLPPRLDVDGNDEDAAPTAASMLRLPPLDARTIAVTAAVVAAGGLNGRERPQSAASGSGGGAIGVPGRLDEADVAEYYKFDSGSRTFKALHTRSFGRSVHAVATRGEFGRRKAVAPTTVGARR